MKINLNYCQDRTNSDISLLALILDYVSSFLPHIDAFECDEIKSVESLNTIATILIMNNLIEKISPTEKEITKSLRKVNFTVVRDIAQFEMEFLSKCFIFFKNFDTDTSEKKESILKLFAISNDTLNSKMSTLKIKFDVLNS